MNIFEYATRNMLRFVYGPNQYDVEDLWRLPIGTVDKIYGSLIEQQNKSPRASLLENKTKNDEKLEVQIAICKFIVEDKLREQEKKENAMKKKEEKQYLLELIQAKKNEALASLSVEELENKLKELE